MRQSEYWTKCQHKSRKLVSSCVHLSNVVQKPSANGTSNEMNVLLATSCVREMNKSFAFVPFSSKNCTYNEIESIESRKEKSSHCSPCVTANGCALAIGFRRPVQWIDTHRRWRSFHLFPIWPLCFSAQWLAPNVSVRESNSSHAIDDQWPKRKTPSVCQR